MTVAQMREVVSNYEYVQWQVYFSRKAQKQELHSKPGRFNP